MLRVAGERETLEHLHRVIEGEIARHIRAIERAHASGAQDLADAITDDECGQIEEVLGLAFVAAQSFITAVRARWTTMVPICRKEHGITLSVSVGKNGYGLFQESPTLPVGTSYRAVDVINGVANFWKHVEEWPTTLVKSGNRLKPAWPVHSMQGNAKHTMEIVEVLGLSPGSTGNLRQAARSMGVTKYSDLSIVRTILFDWAEALHQKARAKLG
jgi:hypothetical protein